MKNFQAKFVYILYPNFECFTKYDEFLCAQFRLCMLKATKAYCYEEVRNYGKNLFIQSIVENGWWGGEKLGDVPVWAQHLLTDSTTLNSHLIMA